LLVLASLKLQELLLQVWLGPLHPLVSVMLLVITQPLSLAWLVLGHYHLLA
jgi:hypothetical protein